MLLDIIYVIMCNYVLSICYYMLLDVIIW